MDVISKYQSVYDFEEMNNPLFKAKYKRVPKRDYLFVEKLEEMTRGASTIETAHDWSVVQDVFEFLYTRYPHEFTEFNKQVDGIRKTRNSKGYSNTKEIMYVGAIPKRFHDIIRKCFPDQQFNKEFVWKLVKKLPILKVSGEKN